jgi:phage-related protein
MTWVVVSLDKRVDDELEAMPLDIQARYQRIAHMISTYGLERVNEPYVKHLEGKLWEMRMKGRDGIARAIYVAVTGKKVVVLRAFIKKTQKTPTRELEIARERLKGMTL